MGKKQPAPPPAPDYAGAAAAQGQANIQSGQQSASLSNPNIYNPYGSQTVSYAPTGPNGMMQPTINQSLNPQAQAALEAQQNVQMQQAQLAQQGMSQAQQLLSQPFQYQGPGIQTSFNQGPGAQLTMGDYGQAQTGLGDYGQVQQQLGNYGQIQNSIGGYGNALRDLDLSGIANMPVNAGQTAQQAILARLNPQLQQQDQALQAQMANQGIALGSEAYTNAMRDANAGKNDLYNQAALAGLNLDMAANQQGFQQALSKGNFSNAGQQQNYQQALGAGTFANAAQQQGFGQLQAQGEFANAAQGQRYQEALGAGNFYNSGQNQNYQQQLGAAGLYNQGIAQNFNQARSAAEFGNNAVGQNLQQQLALYNQPLNSITALMNGSQIQAPQFQQYSGQNIDAAPIFSAANQQAQYNQGIYGQQMAGYNSGMQALGDVAGSAMGMFKFSDARLKSNIVRVGTHPLGIGIYDYDIFGRRERGVMAHEVEAVRPQAVAMHSSGYKVVNYGHL